MISEREIELVQSSWSKVEPIAETAAELFYGRLFEIAPHVKPLFKEEPKKQGRKLMKMLGYMVNGLINLGEIVPAVQDLGVRHIRYNVEEDQYADVGAALLWTLEQGLGEAFTDEVKEAWTKVYGIVSSTMIDAAKQSIAVTA